MLSQVTGDVLHHLKGDQHGEQVTQHFEQVIPKPVGIGGVEQDLTHHHAELHQGGDDHNPGDHR